MLDSRALQLRSDLETSPLSLLRRTPNQVAWKRHLCVNQRLFSVFRSSASVVSTGGSEAGSGALAASVVAGSSVLAVFLTRVHIVKLSQQLHDEVLNQAPLPCGLYPPVGFDVWARIVLVD